ncbi:MAG: biopolymer transporter ExbD [Polyangiaceae bacterium]
MGGVDVGSDGKGRSVNSDINMIPFIDLLMVTIAFLLITAVWVNYSRMNANAQIPGPPNPEKEITPQTPEKVLHLHIKDNEFALVWKQGATVVSESTVPKPNMDGDLIKYADLAKKLGEEWKLHGGHQDKSDKKIDQAVLHADNRLPFKEVIGVLDALYSTKRDMVLGGKTEKIPVFNMSFSVR